MDSQTPWIISIALAVSSSLLSFLTAYISSRHQLASKKEELNHDKAMYEMDLKQQALDKRLNVFYSEKKSIFSTLMDKASSIMYNMNCQDSYISLQAIAHQAILYCDSSENSDQIESFLDYINKNIDTTFDSKTRTVFTRQLNDLADALKSDLQITLDATKADDNYMCSQDT